MIRNYADYSANERTFLAWVRTVIAIVGFGLGVERLSGGTPQLWTEVGMLLSGGCVILFAFLRMNHLRKRINQIEELDDEALPADALLVFLITAFFALLAVFVLHVS